MNTSLRESKRMVLYFPPYIVDKPIIYKLSKDFDIEFNILKAKVTPKKEGILILELSGTPENLKKATEYLEEVGVNLEPFAKEITLLKEKCIDCGLCIAYCPTQALYEDKKTKEVLFSSDKCVACEICVEICPYGAMEVKW